MGSNPFLINGVIQRTQDIGMIKRQEDSKPMLDQQNIQAHQKKEAEQQLKKVKHMEETEKESYLYDAKNKGNGEFHGQNGKRKKKKEKPNGSVVLKQEGGHFDIKV